MNRTMFAAGALLLAGCGMNEDKFATKYAEAVCSYYDQCGTIEYAGGTYDACVPLQENAQLDYILSDACTYDPGAAADCVDEIRGMSCESADTGAGGGNQDTSACASVCG